MIKRRSLAMSILLFLAVLLLPGASFAAFVSGSTGANGDLTPEASTVLQIPESGVFNFGTVNIPPGVTVTFTKNSGNTPITILASGDVTIDGTINLNGTNGVFIIQGTGGPGGFDGGQGGTPNLSGKRGAGPGGGVGGTLGTTYGGNAGGGGFGAIGSTGGRYNITGYPYGAVGGPTYANVQLIPLIGGSGGGGGGSTVSYNGGGGGGGGGVIVIASSGAITINGAITANGGNAAHGESGNCNSAGTSTSFFSGGGGGGSGGGIRLVANIIAGNGTISAAGGSGGAGCSTSGGAGGSGRIRFEAGTITRTVGTNPQYVSGNAYAVVPPNLPVLSISSIAGVSVPSSPIGSFTAPDVILPFNTQNPVTIAVSGTNIPVETTVTVTATPSVGTAVISTATLNGSDASTFATVALNISTDYSSIITASVTYQLTAANGDPLYAEGERIDKIRVAANAGGPSTVTYITMSGREIPAVM